MSPARGDAGQASAEYVGVVAMVAVVLTAGATMLAAPDLPGMVVRQLRLALCLVAGDVCRAADARARGLDPCVTTSEQQRRTTGITVAVVRVGEGKGYVVERRSDGSVVVRATDDSTLGATTGIGLGPVGLDASASAGIGFRRGREWTFPDETSAARFLERIPDLFELTDDGDVHYYGGARAPVRYLEGGGEAGARLEAELGGTRGRLVVPGAVADLRAAIGRRRAPEATTLYYELDAGSRGELAEVLPALRAGGSWVAEWRTTTPPVLTLRTSGLRHDGRRTETAVRLVLDAPGDRAAALEYVLAPLSPALMALAARDLARRVQARGTVERLTYRELEQQHRFEVGGRVGVGAGVDHERSTIRRRLVAAEVVSAGRRALRVDCLAGARS